MTESTKSGGWGLPLLQGILPIKAGQIPAEAIAGLTLAALAIPEVMGYTKISGTPVITGLYTILIPMALLAVFGSSRHLVVSAITGSSVRHGRNAQFEGGAEAVDESHRPEAGMRAGAAAPAGTIGLSGIGSD
jgi:hypothetical protein